MPLVSGKSILIEAQREKRAVIGMDVFNMESAQATVSAAEKLRTPLFLQVCPPGVKYMGFRCAASILIGIAERSSVPVAVHLDHGPAGSPLVLIEQAIRLGLNSVMFDGSKLPFDENVSATRAVVENAHRQNVSVEGELGDVSRNTSADRDEIASLMTDPDEAVEFVEQTGVDYLTVSVGSVSGFFKGSVELDLERLEAIHRRVQVPLVFHGGTSIPLDQACSAVELGVCKINVAHGYRKTFIDAAKKALEDDPEQIDPRVILAKVRLAMESFAEERIAAYARM